MDTNFRLTLERKRLIIRQLSSNTGKISWETVRRARLAPTTVNSSVRPREYLTTAEIERLMAAARKSSRYGHRDATMILIGYRHGLRASELCDLQWSQVELASGRLHVRRAKNGSPSVHPSTSSTPCATPSWHRIGSRTSGVDAAGNAGMHDPPGVGDEGAKVVIAASAVPLLCGLLLARALPRAVARTHSKRRAPPRRQALNAHR
jgi:hypothetical protein